jgi:PAS domain S-box-containing protein
MQIEAAQYPVAMLATSAQLLAQVSAAMPDLVLLDATSTPAEVVTLCQTLRALPAGVELPILVLVPDIAALATDLLAAGATDCLSFSLTEALLLGRIRQMLDAKDTQKMLKQYQYLNALIEVMLVLDAQGCILKIDAGDADYLVLPPAELIGRKLADIMPSERATEFYAYIRTTLETQQAMRIEYDMTIQGKRRWFVAVLSPSGADQVLLVAQDVTRHRTVEEALQESARRYQQLFEYANDAILLIDLQTGNILDANRQAHRLLGYTHDELPLQNIADIEIASDMTQSDTLAASIHSTNRLIMEQVYQHKDGTGIPVESSSRLITYNDRPAILTFSRDIRERKLAQAAERDQRLLAETLRETAAALNSSLSLNEVLKLILTSVARIIESESTSIMLIEAGKARVLEHRGYEERFADPQTLERLEYDIATTATLRWMIQHRQPLLIPDTRRDLRWTNGLSGLPVASYLGAPIIIKGDVMGFLHLDSYTPNHFENRHVQRLEAFINQAALAIHNARLFQQARQYAEELEMRVQERTALLSQANEALKEQIVERQYIEERLEAERNLLQTLIDTIPDEIYIKDTQHRFVLANRATVQGLGRHSLGDVLGKDETAFAISPAMMQVRDQEDLILQTGQTLLNYSSVQEEASGKRWLLMTRLPLRDTADRILGVIGVNRDITEIKQAEAQLEQVLTSARCLLWFAIVEKNGDQYMWMLQIANETAAQRFLPLETGMNSSYTEAWENSILPEDRQKRQQHFETLDRFNRQNYSLELRCRQADGTLRWLIEDAQVRRLTPQRWSVVGVCTDITDRKRAEAALQRNNEELENRVKDRTRELLLANTSLQQQILERQRAEEAERHQRILADALRDGVTAINQLLERDAIFDRILDALKAVVPHDAASIMLLQDNEVLIVHHRGYPDSIQNIRLQVSEMQDFQQILATNTPIIIVDTRQFAPWVTFPEFDWIRANVKIPIRLEDTIIGFLNLDSALPGRFTGEHAHWLQTFADQASIAIRNARMVAEIRSHAADLEQRVQERTVQLQHERAQLQAILDSMRDGVIYRDSHGAAQYVNQAMIDIVGYTETEWLTSEINLNTLPQPEFEQLQKQMSRGLEHVGFWKGDMVLRRKDGSRFDANLTRTIVREKDNEVSGVVSVIRDISQAKQLEEQKRRFIASASHELRTPIANLKIRLHLLRRQPQKFQEHIEIAESVLNLMRSLVDDMFDLSRFERGILELHRETIMVQSFIREVVHYQQPQADHQNITLHLVLPPDPLTVKVDPYRITQVLTNLVTNALHYTPEHGTITVEVTRHDYEWRISVNDTGIGIEPAHLPHLFEPFYRVKPDESKGAGLGLSISQEIIKLHGGSIEVASKVGVGSRFIVRLPLP